MAGIAEAMSEKRYVKRGKELFFVPFAPPKGVQKAAEGRKRLKPTDYRPKRAINRGGGTRPVPVSCRF